MGQPSSSTVHTAVLPRFYIDEDLAEGRICALLPDHPLPETAIWAVHAHTRQAPARVGAFIDHLARRLDRAP